jgi:hypothetical protein
MLGPLCRGGWMKGCLRPGEPSCGCGSHAERAQVDGFDTPLDPRCVQPTSACLVHRAHAIAAMTAAARLSRRREKAGRRLPAAAADPAPAKTTAPRWCRW